MISECLGAHTHLHRHPTLSHTHKITASYLDLSHADATASAPTFTTVQRIFLIQFALTHTCSSFSPSLSHRDVLWAQREATVTPAFGRQWQGDGEYEGG